MRSRNIILPALVISMNLAASEMTSIQDFNVKPENPPAMNKANLQEAAGWQCIQNYGPGK